MLTAVINNDTTSSSSNSSTNPLSTLWSDVQDLFGYNPNNPLPSCFGLFVSSTLSNLSPASPSLSTLGELAGPAYFAMKWNAALKYADDTEHNLSDSIPGVPFQVQHVPQNTQSGGK